eukprot:11998583-Karenia_brevis.AAC.1
MAGLQIDASAHAISKEAAAEIGGDSFGSQLMHVEAMNAKAPPALDGKMIYFAYAELVSEWLEITIIDAETRGPHLRNRLIGEAAIYKSLLGKERMRKPDGWQYLLNTIRKKYMAEKDA